jgi:hypothetical protein
MTIAGDQELTILGQEISNLRAQLSQMVVKYHENVDIRMEIKFHP